MLGPNPRYVLPALPALLLLGAAALTQWKDQPPARRLTAPLLFAGFIVFLAVEPFLIAYLILGTLAVVLLAPSVPALCVSFSAVRDGSATGGATFIFSVTCFAYGMMISALRGSTLDCIFRLNLKRFLPFQGEH